MKTTTKAQQKYDLWNDLLMAGETMWRRHIEQDDGERCFNLHTFLDELEVELVSRLAYNSSPLGEFALDTTTVARLVWCHMALNSGWKPDGTVFRDLPILD